jgi:hypothetical protein
LTPLAEQVRRAKEKVVRDERAGKTLLIPPMPAGVQNVLAEIVTPESQLRDAMPASAQQVWKHVEEVFQLIKAEKILKYAFLRQQERFEKILAAENQNTIPMVRLMQSDAGTKAMIVLKDIGEAIGKLEIGEEWMRGKGGGSSLPYGGLCPGGLLPHRRRKSQRSSAAWSSLMQSIGTWRL